MSSHNKKPTTSSRQARPRAFTTLTQHLSDARGLVSDRIARVRSHSTQNSRLSEKQQQAIFDAVVSSTAFQIPQYQSAAAPKTNLGDPSVDPRSLSLGSTADVPSLSRRGASSASVARVSDNFTESRPLGDDSIDLGAVDSHTMSAATYLMPSYGHMDPYSSHYQTGYTANSSYISEEPQDISRSTPPSTTSYAPNYTTSPALIKDSPRLPQQQSETRQHRSSYTGSYHSTSASPYIPSASPGQGTYGFPSPVARTSQFAAHTPTTHHQEASNPGYASAYSISQTPYGASTYDAAFHNVQTTSAGYVPTQVVTAYPNSQGYVVSSSADLVSSNSEDTGVRILNSRPKPQCWDHGCNGRQFSTFSNLLRHQREKSGTAAKSVCPRCGAEFTRTTARNGHMAHDKCKRKSITSSTGAD